MTNKSENLCKGARVSSLAG